MGEMKLITVEEHYMSKTINDQYQALNQADLSPEQAAKASFVSNYLDRMVETGGPIVDLDQKRLAYMDQSGVSVQILSYGNNSPMDLKGEAAVDLAQQANDNLFEACQKHPDRFYGLACLPVDRPQAAAAELERTVNELGFKGALLQGTFQEEFLDAKRYDPIFAKAEALGVPLQIHPGEIKQDVLTAYYKGDWSDQVMTVLSGHGMGWHYEAGVHMLRLILSGIFDRYPKLQLVAGHWGEGLPYFLERLDENLPVDLTHLDHNIAYYLKHNFYYTPSGMFYDGPFKLCLDYFGPERIVWSVDYPYVIRDNAWDYLANFGLAQEDLEAIAYANAEKLYGIG